MYCHDCKKISCLKCSIVFDLKNCEIDVDSNDLFFPCGCRYVSCCKENKSKAINEYLIDVIKNNLSQNKK